MTNKFYDISKKLYDYFVINKKYFAIQKNNIYLAKNQFINQKTIENNLIHKQSFLCYQEDNNKIKWICFDFDINKEVIESSGYEERKETLYIELVSKINELIAFLKKHDIDFIIEFSGNRGIHLWIVFNSYLTRQDGYMIFKSILEQSGLKLNSSYFSLDKFPKSFYSTTRTDKGLGVKIPLSFHQKSKSYSLLLNSLDDFDLLKIYKNELDEEIINEQYQILNKCKKQSKDELFKKLSISEEHFNAELEKANFLNSSKVTFSNRNLDDIANKLESCKHLKEIFYKKKPSEKERRIVVGLLAQLKENDDYIGKKLLHEFFMKKDNPIESIITERLYHSERLCPPTCEFFRNEFSENCYCKSITETPLEYLDNFSYTPHDIFEINEQLFVDIKKSQIKYSKQNDEISLYHVLNNLKKLEFPLIKDEIDSFFNETFTFEKTYKYTREEKEKFRELHSLSARDKLITTYSIKVLDSIFYKEFSSRSYGYKFNQSFRKYDIFENWLKQWNMYIKELKTLIYADDFKDYYVLKLDISSFYNSINLAKLQLELKKYIEEEYSSGIITENQKGIFFNIVDNLLKLTKDITSKDKGLPQGPVYARYLAEFYLTSLDYNIEKNLSNEGFYFRYVDDIFIIMPDKSAIDLIEDVIVKHLSTKYLHINQEKTYKGMINTFRNKFEGYVDNTKYFVDQVQKHENINTLTTVHEASSKLLNLINEKDGTINDKNLSFLYTHLENSKMIQDKKEELESYIINDSLGRGSFFNIFWRYYFNKYEFTSIDFSLFNNLYGLKRESFLNSLIIILNGTEEENLTLKKLLDYYLSSKLTYLEKLLILEIYMIDNELFNSTIVNIIGDDIAIYNDLVLSEYSKVIPNEILDVIESKLGEFPDELQFDYLYNIMLYSEIEDISVLNKFSRFFINNVNTIINFNVETNIEYLNKSSKVMKYIQVLYLSTLFYKNEVGDDFLQIITPIWNNLFFNLNANGEKINIEQLSFWLNKLEPMSLEYSNIHDILVLLKNDQHWTLTNGYVDNYNIIGTYFDSLIEIIYLENKDTTMIESLSEIKEYLINEKNMIYLKWIDGDAVYYPTQDICLRNSVHNNITVLRKENKILIRLKNDLPALVKEFNYLENIEETVEDIFSRKYKTIIYTYNTSDYRKIEYRNGQNVIEYVQDVVELIKNLKEFSIEYYSSSTFINCFYNQFRIHKTKGTPLIPYEGYARYFIKSNGTYDIKSLNSFSKNIINMIDENCNNFFNADNTNIFKSFEQNFFPSEINNKLKFLEIFASITSLNIPQTIFELEDRLSETILEYIEQDKRNLYSFLNIYLSFRRNDFEFLLFDKIDDFVDTNLEQLIYVINSSLESSIINELFEAEKQKLIEKLGELKEFKKENLVYRVKNEDEIEIEVGDEFYDLSELEYIDINTDELIFNTNINEDKLLYLKNSITYVRYDNESFKCQIVVVPKIIEKIHSIILQRSEISRNIKNITLFRNVISLDELKEEEDFSPAVNVLRHHYKYSDILVNEEVISNHLYSWLYPFHKIEEKRAFLNIIANHQYFSETNIEEFINKIKEYINQSEYLITSIKKSEDNNGTHRLITLKADDDLWRDIGLDSFPKKLVESKTKKIVLLSDNMVSGGQTINSFKYYYLNEEHRPEEASQNDFFEIEVEEFEIFKQKFMEIEELVFISVFYTDKAEQRIRNYFKKEVQFQGDISFYGEKKTYKDCVFYGLINEKNKSIFKAISQNLPFLNTIFNIENKGFYRSSSEVKEKEEEFGERNLIARYSSMTKKRFFIFTLIPKYHDKPLFQYRPEKKI